MTASNCRVPIGFRPYLILDFYSDIPELVLRLSVRGWSVIFREVPMAVAALDFGTSLLKMGVGGLTGVVRDRASAHRYNSTGRPTAPTTDFDPFARHTIVDPYPEYRALLTGPNV